MVESRSVLGFQLQDSPRIYVAALPGKWLLTQSTPYWRIKDPMKGFQRYVNEDRARKIALGVLDQQRTFPNAIVLATDVTELSQRGSSLDIAAGTRFFVVDGQHRLFAQKFSSYETTVCCVIHMGLTEAEMARLFLEINDNQKRVPSSLRWDLIRLVRPEENPQGLAAAELVYQLATLRESPLFQHIDLTGELDQISLKQGSIAPELKKFIKSTIASKLDFDSQLQILIRYLAAIKSLDTHGWKQGSSPFYKARILRALIRILKDILADKSKKSPPKLTSADYYRYLTKIRAEDLDSDKIRAIQGNAGIRALYNVLKRQMFKH